MYLTRREKEALPLLANGFSNAEIADKLDIGLPTVALHLVNARKRLGAKSREHAIALAIRAGLIEPVVAEKCHNDAA